MERQIKVTKQKSLRQIHDNRNKVLFIRTIPALGDILMHRMLFEDVKAMGFEVHFACRKAFHPAIVDHPYIDQILDSENVNLEKYPVRYVNDKACTDYEERMGPLALEHRSDLWAENCGFKLTHHNMHIGLTPKEKEEGFEILTRHRHVPGPLVIITPISTRTAQRTLLDHQVNGAIEGLLKRGFCPIGLHSMPISYMNIPVIHGLSIRQLLSVVYAIDYAVSVDTGTFHCAGGMGKPTLGIFTSADGEVYGKYYTKFELVQKHRNKDPLWTCGPCYNWSRCPKSDGPQKPCLTELTANMILEGFDKLVARFPHEGNT